jgi:HlyD family secretion protein
MKKRRRILWGAFLLLILAGLGWFLYGRWRGPVVPVVEVETQNLVRTIVASGRVVSATEAIVGAERVGVVSRVLVDEGDPVEAGDALVELDARSAQADVARARAAVAAARAQLREVANVNADVAAANLTQAEAALAEARDNFRRSEALAKAGAISQAALDNARRTLTQAESQVRSARAQANATGREGAARRRAEALLQESKAALEAANARLAQSVIRAPSDGTVLTRSVEPGDVTQPGSRLLRIGNRAPPQLLIQPDEKNLAELRLGQHARASADAFPEATFAAVVTEIAPAVDPQRGTVDVTLDIRKPPPFLRPDMTVSVEIITGSKEDALAVPLAGVRGRNEEGERPWVYIVKQGRTARQPVTLGLEGEEAVQVTAGLRDGDRVVAVPRNDLRSGQRVRSRAIRGG